jgi:4-hydroxy-3-methylbut-2-enyl diphosphate reductase
VTQTTLSTDDAALVIGTQGTLRQSSARRRTTSHTTQNRQDAVKILVPEVDAVIVVGSRTVQFNRLQEVAANRGVPAYMIDRARNCSAEFAGKQRVGVTAGASAPEVLVRDVITRLKELGALGVSGFRACRESDVSAARGLSAAPRQGTQWPRQGK